MPTELLTIGPPTTLTQNVVYALPARSVTVHSNAALQVSNVVAFTTSQAITANTPTKITGGFVRCTASDAIVTLKVD